MVICCHHEIQLRCEMRVEIDLPYGTQRSGAKCVEIRR